VADLWPSTTSAQRRAPDPNDFQYSSADLEAIAAYAAAQGVASTTVSRGLVSGDNLLPNGDFTSGFGAGWTTDAPALIKPNTQNKGSYPNATQSIEINSGATNKHLFSPKVAVEAGQAYVIKELPKRGADCQWGSRLLHRRIRRGRQLD
jgi:hypothetical protein